ncbi:TetR/AcrR family transcriptional regulator [Streptomyces mutomycini]|nr:hypothetical protein ADK82_01755 [Streptomyces sp. NRRL S-4]
MGRGSTRARIKEMALELFTKQGYEGTSLREIAEHLGVTKAAVYCHFKTKEGILAELLQERTQPIEDVIAWAEAQPLRPDVQQEALRRYEGALAHAAPIFTILRENQGNLRDLAVGASFRALLTRTLALFRPPGADLVDQVRAVTALIAVHTAAGALSDADATVDEKRAAALTVGLELLASAHRTGLPARQCRSTEPPGSPGT